jgi:hypothetical protein
MGEGGGTRWRERHLYVCLTTGEDKRRKGNKTNNEDVEAWAGGSTHEGERSEEERFPEASDSETIKKSQAAFFSLLEGPYTGCRRIWENQTASVNAKASEVPWGESCSCICFVFARPQEPFAYPVFLDAGVLHARLRNADPCDCRPLALQYCVSAPTPPAHWLRICSNNAALRTCMPFVAACTN